MQPIEIFPAESDIASLIQNNNSISHIVECLEVSDVLDSSIFPLHKLESSNFAERNNFDLFSLKSLLVSSVWNGNDDYFCPKELWLARNTVVNKPFNYEHDEHDIIGHITNSYVVDSVGNVLSETTELDNLPDVIHIICGAVLYKYWSDKTQRERIDKLIAEIRDGKWHVSVECLFTNFDYLLKSDNNTYKLIARNEKTAFLSKYLRIYKGSGVYNNQKIARVPRNFIISGKGLVKTPANSSSEIFACKFDVAKNNCKNIQNNLEMVYEITEVNKMNEKDFADLQNKYKQLEVEYTSLKASLNENKNKDLENKVADLTKSVEAGTQEVNVLKASLEKTVAEKENIAKSYEEVLKVKTDFEAKLQKIEADARYNERINLCKANLGMDDEQAKNYTDNLNLLTDEAFKKHVEFQSAFVKAKAAKIEPTPAALEKPEVAPTPSLTAPTNTVSKQEEIAKLAASLAEFKDKSGFVKKGETKFKK